MENEIIDLFEQIKATSSSNEKIRLIKENAGNELFKKALVFLMDNRVVTGLSKAKINKTVTTVPSRRIITFENMMDYLIENNTGTDQNIANVQSFIEEQPAEVRDWYREFFTKRYKIGVTVKSVNKAIPNLIWTWNVQQGFLLNDKNRPKYGDWFCISQKLNGVNCGYLDGEMYSRQGKPYSHFDHIIKEINDLGLTEKFINGELIRINNDDLPDDENFQKSISIINSDMVDKREIKFVIYEVLTKEEFLNGESHNTFKKRLEFMKQLDSEVKEFGCNYVEVVPYFYEGDDQRQIERCLEYADERGMEGVMINLDTRWLDHRNNGLLKVKTFHSADLRCLRVEEGDGKLKGTLGKIICDYKGYELGVGSGFTDTQRKLFWEDPALVIGKIIEVKYKTETKNKDGGISVQFPVFICIKTDKDEVSYN